MRQIPCLPDGASNWTQRTQLTGVEYLLTFDWNQRLGRWLLSIADANGAQLYSRLPLVVGMALIAQEPGVRRIPFDLVVIDATGANDVDPGFVDLGSRFLLLYAGDA